MHVTASRGSAQASIRVRQPAQSIIPINPWLYTNNRVSVSILPVGPRQSACVEATNSAEDIPTLVQRLTAFHKAAAAAPDGNRRNASARSSTE